MKDKSTRRQGTQLLHAAAAVQALDLAATMQLHKELSQTALSLVATARKKAQRGEYQLLKILIGYSRAAARRQQADERVRQAKGARPKYEVEAA